MSENFLDFYFKNKMGEEDNNKKESVDSLESMTTSEPVKTKQEFKQTRKIDLAGLNLESTTIQTTAPKPTVTKQKPIASNPVSKPVPKPVYKPSEKPIPKTKPKGEEPLEGNALEKLFIQSETPTSLKEQWVSYYRNSFVTKKKIYQAQKIKKGLFRLANEGGTIKIQILSDYVTYGKETKDILKDLTKPGGSLFKNNVG